jgi:hypothetical protein
VRVVGVALLTAVLVHSTGSSGAAQTRIKTPFQVMSLWSEEMLDYIVGTRQQACSGANAERCERIDSGLCDGIANIAFKSGSVEPLGHTEANRQRQAAKPQMFSVGISNAVYGDASGRDRWTKECWNSSSTATLAGTTRAQRVDFRSAVSIGSTWHRSVT